MPGAASRQAPSTAPPPTNREKVLIAGCGALIPLLANVMVVDPTVTFQYLTAITLIVYLLKTMLCFGTGCLMGYLRKSEHDLMTLFLVGLSVPAFLIGVVNQEEYAKLARETAKSRIVPPYPSTGPPSPHQFSLFFGRFGLLPDTVFANSSISPVEPKVFSVPAPTTSDQVLRGLGITPPYRGYYVIAATYSDSEDAETAAGILRQRGFQASVYAPYGSRNPLGDTPYLYSVAIAEQTTDQQASTVLKAAKDAGLNYAFMVRFVPLEPGDSRYSTLVLYPVILDVCAPSSIDEFSIEPRNIHPSISVPYPKENYQLYVYANDIQPNSKVPLLIWAASQGSFSPDGQGQQNRTPDFSHEKPAGSLEFYGTRGGYLGMVLSFSIAQGGDGYFDIPEEYVHPGVNHQNLHFKTYRLSLLGIDDHSAKVRVCHLL